MKELLRKARIFINALLMTFTRVEEKNVYVPAGFTRFNVSIVNPSNGKFLVCNTIITNGALMKNDKVDIYLKHKVLMELLVEYLYQFEDNLYIKNQFPNVFNINEIQLMHIYFRNFVSFQRLVNKNKDFKIVSIV